MSRFGFGRRRNVRRGCLASSVAAFLGSRYAGLWPSVIQTPQFAAGRFSRSREPRITGISRMSKVNSLRAANIPGPSPVERKPGPCSEKPTKHENSRKGEAIKSIGLFVPYCAFVARASVPATPGCASSVASHPGSGSSGRRCMAVRSAALPGVLLPAKL